MENNAGLKETLVFENGELEFYNHTLHGKVQTLGFFCKICGERLSIDQVIDAKFNGGHCREEK